MSGCFGNSPEDRYFENQLMNHLEEEDKICCHECGWVGDIDHVKHAISLNLSSKIFKVNINDNCIMICPVCLEEIK